MLRLFMNLFMLFIHVEFSYFYTLDAVDAINNICSTY